MEYKKIKYEYLYLFTYIGYLVLIMLQYTFYVDFMQNNVFKILRYLCYLVFLVKLFQDEMSPRQLIIVLLLFAVAAVTAMQSDNKRYLFYFMAILGAKGIDSRRLLKVYIAVQWLLIIFTIISSQIGIIPDNISGVTGRSRHGLGFTWVNFAPTMYFLTLAAYLYLRGLQTTWLEYILLLAVAYWFYKMTNTRMMFAMALGVLFASVLYRAIIWLKLENFVRKFRHLVIASPVIACVFAIWLHAIYNPDNSLLYRINSLFSGRLYWGKLGIQNYGYSLLGQPIQWIGMAGTSQVGQYNYVDCSYLQLLLEHGLLFLIVALYMYIVILRRAVKKNDIMLQLVIMLVLVFAITEPRLVNIAFNPFPFLFLESLEINESKAAAKLCASGVTGILPKLSSREK